MGIEFDNEVGKDAKIIVVGIGGGGNNAVDRMIQSGMDSVKFVAMNTDKHVLLGSKADTKLQLGEKLTRGLGAGANPEIGEKAALENKDDINNELEGVDMVFIAAGMGGGTGTGAAPVVAELARTKGILTVAVVTKPFMFEGRTKMLSALKGIEKLRSNVDSLVVIPNDNIMKVVDEKVTMTNAFRLVDEVLSNAVQGICDIITRVGVINIDFADVKTTMSNKGMVHMGVGKGSGKNRAEEALKRAVDNPLLETKINNAKSVLINYYGDNISMQEISFVNNIIYEAVDPDAQIIFGSAEGEDTNEEIQITIIAAGFDDPATDDAPATSLGTNIIEPMVHVPQAEAAPVAPPVAAAAAAVTPKPVVKPDDSDFEIPPFLKNKRR